MPKYIWQKQAWPNYTWDAKALIQPLGACRFQQGALLTKMEDLNFDAVKWARAEILTAEALNTSAIENLSIDPGAVRSSVAIRLGLPTADLPPAQKNRDAEGIVQVLLDAAENHRNPLTMKRLYGWHAALFPTGYSGLIKISVGRWRTDKNGPMKVVSGPAGNEITHYMAPPASRVSAEMKRFIAWWKRPPKPLDGILRSGIAHLWFVQIHPFDHGNGRITRALSEMALSQDENIPTRFYSLSSQIQHDINDYYDILNSTGRGNSDITKWLDWYLRCMARAIVASESLLQRVMDAARFWKRHAQTQMNAAQKKAVERLLDKGRGGFEGGLNNRKYRNMNRASRAKAQRDLADLVKKGMLLKNPGGGRSISYDLNWKRIRGTAD
jgi:Fic family protein